jgi:hypothetical protein
MVRKFNFDYWTLNSECDYDGLTKYKYGNGEYYLLYDQHLKDVYCLIRSKFPPRRAIGVYKDRLTIKIKDRKYGGEF